MVHRSKSRLEDAMHSRSDCASPEPPSRNSQVHISDQVLVERKISSPNYESLRKRMISPSNMHTLFNHNSKPKTAYHTEEGTVESWDIQYRCRRALKRGGIVDDELQKIFVFYFPFTVSKGFERSHGNLSQPNSDLQARGCRLEEYWKFWKDVGFFEGPYRDSPPFFINKSFAVGCGMQELFLDFSAENSCGRQLKMKGAAVELSLEGWCRALREMGQLVLGHVARDPRAASERFIYEVVLPNCRRDKPNPVLTHFKRAEVSALLERYRTPLLRLFEHLCGTAPNVFAMLTPDAAPARGAPQPQPDAVRSQASEEAETDGGASGKGSRSAGQGIEEHGMRAGEAACGSAARMNVEEFLLFCRTMDLCPALVSELSLRYIFAHANVGLDSDADAAHLDFPEFLQCLCRIALLVFGSALLVDTEPGQPGEPGRLFHAPHSASPVVPRRSSPAPLLPREKVQALFSGCAVRCTSPGPERGVHASREAPLVRVVSRNWSYDPWPENRVQGSRSPPWSSPARASTSMGQGSGARNLRHRAYAGPATGRGRHAHPPHPEAGAFHAALSAGPSCGLLRSPTELAQVGRRLSRRRLAADFLLVNDDVLRPPV